VIDAIDVVHRDKVAIFHMTHGKANALDVEFCEAIAARLEEFRHSSIQALVLIGQGQIFSAGVDLLRVLDGGPAYVKVLLPTLSNAFEILFGYPKPVVAAINGHAIAGGCVLACAADYRVMAQQAGRIGVPELLVGVPFPTIALEIMRFVAAPQHLQALLYGGATLSPESAADQGLVDAIAEPEKLLEQAVLVAETLAALPPAAFTLTKRQVLEPVLKRVREDGPRFDAAVEELWAAPKTLAAIRDYVAQTFKRSEE
jgi:enoyl-CoA hydratase/carnithine racemase